MAFLRSAEVFPAAPVYPGVRDVGRNARRLFAAICALGLVSVQAPRVADAAEIVPGGGLRRTDCVSAFQVNADESLRGRRIVCTDGDPGCDEDGLVDGVCTLSVGVCLNVTNSPRCSSPGAAWLKVEHSEDDGDPLFDPEFQALQARIDNGLDFPETEPDQCSSDAVFRVPVDGPRRGGDCRAGRKVLQVEARSIFEDGRALRDRDRLHLVCRPAPGGCDEQVFFEGTLDRIQRQVFDRRCATGGCHDSESNAGGLLLELGASYSSLVNVSPVNPAAASAGLVRVAPGVPGDSFLWRKLTGELGPGEGARMPEDAARLPLYLRNLIEEWIVAGAPPTGWVE